MDTSKRQDPGRVHDPLLAGALEEDLDLQGEAAEDVRGGGAPATPSAGTSTSASSGKVNVSDISITKTVDRPSV